MVSLNIDLSGKHALITGSSRGLGLDAAEGFVRAGISTVFITLRKGKAVDEAVKYLQNIAKEVNPKCRVLGLAADIAKDEGIHALHDWVAGEVPLLHILVANAGASWGAPLDKHPLLAVRKVLDLNVTAVFATIQAFVPMLKKAGTAEDPARIITTGSVAGILPELEGGTYGYLASKAGVNHLGKALALELGPLHITSNVIAPGMFPTKMSNGLLEIVGDGMVKANPLGRLGRSEDFMGLIVYLVGGLGSAYINGIVLPIDGGLHLKGPDMVGSKL